MAQAPIGFERERRPLRLWLVPVATTVCGSLAGLLPIVVDTPWWPPLGLLMALGWRLLRPEMWPAWVALPLGLLDDLIGGTPLGASAGLWTVAFLVIDIPDTRMVYRSFVEDWQIAVAAIVFVASGQWGIAQFEGAHVAPWTIVPQTMLAVFAFPMALRLCARLDRWRLRGGPGFAP